MKVNDLDLLKESTIIESAVNMMEMANLFPKDTGVEHAIWFGEVGGQHGPRIKVSNIRGKMSSDCFVMNVSKMPVVMTPTTVKISQNDIENISDWIVLNYKTLMKMWQAYEAGDGQKIAALTVKLKKI